MEPVIPFRDAMQAVYGPLDWLPIPDGSIRRFHCPGDKAGSSNGWYLLFADGIASGCFGSWKEGTTRTWSSRKPTDYLESQLLRQRIEEAKRQRVADQHQRQQSTAEKANRDWHKATAPDPLHPYLISKQIRPHTLRQSGDVLLVPLYYAGQLVNLQRIYPDGSKRFMPGGMVKGCYSPLGSIKDGQPLYVCEGFATGATIHEDTGHPVACAMNANNLLPVGQYLQRQHPDAVLIIAGDDDRKTDGNPGRTAANKAAVALGCGVVFPVWPEGAPMELRKL
jgi:putative DNA primase/helicase